MRALLDVNMLLALCDPKHLHHGRAQHWRLSWSGGWASCPLTQNGFLRIVTQTGYPNPLLLADALVILERLTARPDHAFWPDDASLLDRTLIDRQHMLSPRALTDIYLLALAVRNGGALVTLDRGVTLKAVRNAEATNLVIVT